jgi:bifunctional non-homologous end joining protein LigD
MMKEQLHIEPYTVAISNAEKVLFPMDGITKGELIKYYYRIAATMVPHMRGRPITMQRFPDGITNEGFYHKEAPEYFPDWIQRVAVELKEGGSQYQIVCANAATLVYLADQACITPHAWLSRADQPDYPDRMVFDFDPSDDTFQTIRSAAQSLGRLLREIGLVPFVMTTGSRGVHVVVPLDRSADFDTVRSFAKEIAEMLARHVPGSLTTETRKDQREARVFLDYLRNAYGQTAVVPYAVRAKPGAPVAAPIEWNELSDRKLHPQRYTIHNIFRRLARKADPWRNIHRHARSLSKLRHRLNDVVSRLRS